MRLIDADALIEKWYEVNNIGPEDRGAIFIGYTEIPRFINNAPTVEPTGDLISRADAIRVISEEYYNRGGNFDGLDAIRELETLPSKGGDAEILNEDFRPKYMQQCPNNGADLISRADAIEAVWNEYEAEFNDLPDIPRYHYEKVVGKMAHEINMLKEQLESADATQGEWIKHKGEWVDLDFYPTKYECSQCHYYVDEGHDSIFCPNCGARMKGGDEE